MEGGSQAQDHGQAIYAKIRCTVSQLLLQLVVAFTSPNVISTSPPKFFDKQD